MKLNKNYYQPIYLKGASNNVISTKNILVSSLLTLTLVMMLSLIGCNKVTNFWNATTLFKGSNSKSIQKMSPEKLYNVQNNDLCAAYHGSLTPTIKNEISRRGLIESDQWADINKNEVWKGMTYCQIFASLGKPKGAVMGEKLTEFSYPTGTYSFLNGELVTFSKQSDPLPAR